VDNRAHPVLRSRKTWVPVDNSVSTGAQVVAQC